MGLMARRAVSPELTERASGSQPVPVAADSFAVAKSVGGDGGEGMGEPDERGLLERALENAPPGWVEEVSALPKVYGLTEKERAKIESGNEAFVEPVPLATGDGLGTAMAICAMGSIGTLVMRGLNSLRMYRMDILYDAIEHRPSNAGLLTFSNHKSVADDPLLMSAMLPRRILRNPGMMRWGLCSIDICYQNSLLGRFFTLGKALPIQRYGGIGQPFLAAAASKLINGDWVHIYPEGRVRQTGMGYAKRGVGKMLAMAHEARDTLPIIVPIYHEGAETVMPQCPDTNNLTRLVPRIGKKLFAIAGEPIDLTHVFNRLMPDCVRAGGTANDPPECIKLYEEASDFLALTLRLLRAELRHRVLDDHGVSLGDPHEVS